MFDTSRDILNIVIAVSIAGFTFFVCWAIFYFIMMLRQSFKIVKEMRQRLLKIDEVINLVKEKIQSSTSYLVLIGEGVKKLLEMVNAKKQESKKTKKQKS